MLINIPVVVSVRILTGFQGYGARSGSSSARYEALDYQGGEKGNGHTPPTVGDITTKNCVPSSEHPYMYNLGNGDYRNQCPFAPVFSEERTSGIHECRSSQYRGGHPDLHGILDIGLFQSASDDPERLLNLSPECEG